MMNSNDYHILAIIPARGGSKGVPRKNLRKLLGKPLIQFAIEEAKKSKYIERTILSTEDEEIASIAKDLGAEVPFKRPEELAGDFVTDLPVFKHCLNWLEANEGYVPDIVVHLRPTAPLRRVKHIDDSIALLIKNPEADSVRSVTDVEQHPLKMWKIVDGRLVPFIPEEVYGIKESYNMSRQKLPKAYKQNGAVDIVWRKTIIEKNSMTGDTIIPYIMDPWDSVNIDHEIDLLLAEQILKSRRMQK